jgi:Ca2+-transporting ATPase
MAQNNDARVDASTKRAVGDPTETALLECAAAGGYDVARLEARTPRVGEVAFQGERRRMTTLHASGEGGLVFVKGAPETVLSRCSGALQGQEGVPLDAATVLARAEELAAEGNRVLAFAHRRLDAVPTRWSAAEIEQDLTFLGLVALLDPPREEAPAAIAECLSAGIRPIMITGDHPGTARAIAARIGIGSDRPGVLTGRDLERMNPADLERRVAEVDVYARVSPEQKIDIVRALQTRGEFVAMTGDGVNDAPALKRAEIGVAMGRSGTEVAREAADMTLLDDDFATIVAAIREGRRVFDNIRKFVKYTMTSNAGEIGTLFLAPFLGLPLPLLPIHILWINLVTDGLPGLALSSEPEEGGLMRRPPRPPNESLFAHGLGRHIVWVGLLIAGLSIGAQAWSYHAGSRTWQSVVFTTLTLCQLVHALAIRSERTSLFALGLRSNLPLLGAVLSTVALQLAVLYLPWLQAVFHTTALPPAELAVCFLLPLVVLAAVEVEKLLARRRIA